MGNIVCSIDSNEPVAEAPESVQLERGLNTEHKCTLIQSQSWWGRIQLIIVKYRYIFGFKSVNP
jgi:hypothetical protein